MNNVVIKTGKNNTEVFLNGVKLKGITHIKFEETVDDIPVITISFVCNKACEDVE